MPFSLLKSVYLNLSVLLKCKIIIQGLHSIDQIEMSSNGKCLLEQSCWDLIQLMGDFLSLRKGLKDRKQVQEKLLTKANSMTLAHDS